MKTGRIIQVLTLIGLFFTLFFTLSVALADHFTGSYANQDGVKVTIEQNGNQVGGTFEMQGQQFQIQGQGGSQGSAGVLQSQAAQFGYQAQISQDLNTLQMTIFPPNAQGQPDTSRAQQLTLQRSDTLGPFGQNPETNQPNNVPEFSGSYQDQQGSTVNIQQNSNGQLQGTFQMQGQQFQLQGQSTQQGTVGVLMGQSGQFGFQAQLSPDTTQLQMVLFPANEQGQPDTSKAQQLSFQRTESAGTPISTNEPIQPGLVIPPSVSATSTGWTGKYSDGELTMTLQSTNNTYEGTLELGGAEYPAQAKESQSGLEGIFLSGNDQFQFTVVRQTNNVVLTTGGRDYVLTAETQEGGNPLGNPAGNPLGN